MILIDANILIYAYNPDAPQHAAARLWLEATLSRQVPVRLAWTTVLAFLRIMTHPQVFDRPLSPQEAVAIVDDWLALPAVALLDPSDRHWPLLRERLVEGQARGALATDAHLAALAVEHGAVLFTTDRDFSRFKDVRVVNPRETSR